MIYITPIILALAFTSCTADLYLTNKNVTEICVMNEESCEVVIDRKRIEDIMENKSEEILLISNEDEFGEIKSSCFLSSRFWKEQYGFIYPGTLWCGRGSKADNYNQLGVHSKEDSCCREHDNCPSALTKGQCKANLCNQSRITRSHCECDRKFQECLRNSTTETANTIGAIFFNIAQIFCFEELPKCPQSARVVVEETPRRVACPFEFRAAGKYTFTRANFAAANWKAYYFNKLLRLVGLGGGN